VFGVGGESGESSNADKVVHVQAKRPRLSRVAVGSVAVGRVAVVINAIACGPRALFEQVGPTSLLKSAGR
jgi:hypothetical protein